MKCFSAIVTTAVAICATSAFSQGFINLDFENAVVTPVSGNPGRVVASDAAPGWAAYIGGNAQSAIGYDTVGLGGAAVFLEDTNASSFGGPLPFQGAYGILLEGSTAGQPTAASIGQTGQVPLDAISVTFLLSLNSNVQLTFAGQNIPLIQIGSTSNYQILAGDISAFSGQTGQLFFIANPGTTLTAGGGLIDDIQFSSTVIPEPAESALGAIGAIVFGFYRVRNFRR